jgi:hypothetical protein
MGASKESPATQIFEWAVGKLDEAAKTDWAEKFNSFASSKPAYLRNGLMTASAPSMPAPAPSGGPSQADVEAALSRAAQAEAKAAQADARAESLARRVSELEKKLAGANSHRNEVSLPAEEAHEDDEHKSHWWSRH